MAAFKTEDIYNIITDRIIELLEEGVVPWSKCWSSPAGGVPQNFISKKPYRGINAFLLAFAPYQSPYWMTFKQAKDLGGSVKKGEKSTLVVFWKLLKKTEDGEEKSIPLLRYYRIFNLEQCDIPEDKIPETQQVEEFDNDPLEQCEAVVSQMKDCPEIRHEGFRAYYKPSVDQVTMPEREHFHDSEAYYATLFHELSHSTGHKSRLNRDGIKSISAFGSEDYSKEELIAEMSSSFLCGACGIENSTIERSAAYLQSWLKVLKSDSKMIIQAAGKAQKSADFILGTTFDVYNESE